MKNKATAAAKHIRSVKARARIALTGTPMENNLEEFWALFDWRAPGLLGDRKGFNARYRTPIEKGGSLAAQESLNARVRPVRRCGASPLGRREPPPLGARRGLQRGLQRRSDAAANRKRIGKTAVVKRCIMNLIKEIPDKASLKIRRKALGWDDQHLHDAVMRKWGVTVFQRWT